MYPNLKTRLIVHSPKNRTILQDIITELSLSKEFGLNIKTIPATATKPASYVINYNSSLQATKKNIAKISALYKTDISLIPPNFDKLSLIISDMDSTLINIECLDEIAGCMDLKQEVAEITGQAMRGEINFSQSLQKRLSLVAGMDIEALDYVYNNLLQLNPGGKELLTKLKKTNIKFALISGGFTFFTNRLQDKYLFEFARANELEVINNKLTGNLLTTVIDGAAKKSFLQEICQNQDIQLNQTLAIGDGANDLQMMKIAGISVAYRAKIVTQQQSTCQFNFASLENILDFSYL